MTGDDRHALTPPGGRRPLLLAGGLLGAAGLADLVAGLSAGTGDPYMVLLGGGMYHLDLTGWAWAHGIDGVVTALVGLLVLAGRRPIVVAATAAGAVSLVVDLLILPYEPYRSVLSAGLTVAALRLLVQCLRHGGAPGARGITPADRPGR